MRKAQVIAGMLAGAMMLSSLGFTAGHALARSPLAAREDQAQLKADRQALAREQAQLRKDEQTFRSDKLSGKMAAESPDSYRVYKDEQAIKAQEKAIGADHAKLHADSRR